METSFIVLTTTRSSFLSPLKSTTTTERGRGPTGKSVLGPNDPVPSPRRMETILF